MNETHSYDPESFHPSLMHSVHVALDGSKLCLGHPQTSIPRWASFDEAPHEASLSRSRTYQLANSKVSVPFCNITGPFLILGCRREGIKPAYGVRGEGSKYSSKVTPYMNSSISSVCSPIVIRH